MLHGSDGFLYGTTAQGGDFGKSTVFRIAKNGTGFLQLKSFNCLVEGCFPYGALIEGSDGNLYGTRTQATGQAGNNGGGAIFKIAKNGTAYTQLKSFNICSDPANIGSAFRARLIEVNDGTLYGTSVNGGAFGGGTVFKIAKDGSGFVLLKSFQCFVALDGCRPEAAMLEASDGDLYGTTSSGVKPNSGTVFKIAKNGTGFVLIKSFNCSDATDGCNPYAQLLETSDGMLYGTTLDGGTFRYETVFRIRKNGNGFRLLKSFDCFDAGNGCDPFQSLITQVMVFFMAQRLTAELSIEV